jgi:hypothetical protein
MEQPQVKVVRVKGLKPAPHNPAHRIGAARIRKLVESMSEVGLIYPILIDQGGVVIDGHRRLAAAKKLGWKEVPAIVCSGDRDRVYASVNVTAVRMTGNDALGVWLSNPGAVTPHTDKYLAKVESVVGRDLLRRMYRHGLSASTYRMAVQIARYCDCEDSATVARVIEWLMTLSLTFQARKAMEAGESPRLLLRAVRGMKPIRMKLAIGND